jgi:hypothetical protein
MMAVTALLLSAGCTSQTSPPQAAAPAPVSPAQPGVPATTLQPVLPTAPAAATVTMTVPPAPMTPIEVNDIISLDNTLYYVYAQDPSVYYLKEVEENASKDGYVYAGAATDTGIKQPLMYVNTNAHYITHVDPYGSDAVRSRTTTSAGKGSAGM